MAQGVPINWSDELIEKICELVEKGYPFDYAFRLNNISTVAGYDARKRGVKDQSQSTQEYKLLTRMNHAKSRYCTKMVEHLHEYVAKAEDWKGAMTILERRDPTNYSKVGSRQENDFDYDEVASDLDDLTKQMAKLINLVNSGKIDSEEAARRSKILSDAANIQEKTETRLLVEEIKDRLDAKGD